jgi:hypothetical protein
MAGYSGTPLVKKLGLKPNSTLYFYDAPADYFDWIGSLPENTKVASRLSVQSDFIHVFATQRKIFEAQFRKAKSNLKKDGMLWISWPKKASGVQTDLDENVIREFGLREGLVDVKVCAVSEVWSGLKFVFRVKDR